MTKPIEQQTLSQLLAYEPSEPQWAILIQKAKRVASENAAQLRQ